MKEVCGVVWLLLLFPLTVGAVNPGFKARITNKGLKYANDVAIQDLKTNVAKATIPDQRGSDHGFKYSVTNIHVTKFDPPASTIAITPGKGLTWTASNADISIHGDFHYKKWFISDGGSFTADVSGVSFSVEMDIGKDGNGRPSIASRNCGCSIGHVKFKFHGHASVLYNLFSDKVARVIRDSLNGQMCTFVNKAVNEDGEKHLAKIRVTTPLAKIFLLDYRLSQNPAFQTQYMETYHKGEIYWLSAAGTECPLTPPAMPANNDTDSMLYLWISDYMYNTMGYTAQKHGVLVSNMTRKDLPPEKRGVLNTTCDSLVCIGNLIPLIGQKYPNSSVELRMNSTVAPTMTITSAGVELNFTGTIDLYARKSGSSVSAFLLALNATLSTTVSVSIQNELLYAKVNNLKLNLKVERSAVGSVSDYFLNFLIKQALNVYLVPQLNDFGMKGFPLPVTGQIKFVNTKLSFAKDTLLISTDLKYLPSLSMMDDQTGPLKYQPRVHIH